MGNARECAQRAGCTCRHSCCLCVASGRQVRGAFSPRLGNSEITRQDMQRASGLPPQKFDHAVTTILNAIQSLDQGRDRRPSRRASLSMSQEQRMDKRNLYDIAKKVQSGEFLHKKDHKETDVPVPNAAIQPAKQVTKPRPSGPHKVKVNKPESASKRKLESVERTRNKVPASMTPPAGPVHQSFAPRQSNEDLYRTRLLSLGLPAYRQGIKFEAQPIRKRGRPPAPKLTPQELSDRQYLASLWAKQPPMQEKKRSMAGVPPRYAFANLSTTELHWMRPMPMPLSISTQDPSGYRLPPTDIWRRWSETMFSS